MKDDLVYQLSVKKHCFKVSSFYFPFFFFLVQGMQFAVSAQTIRQDENLPKKSKNKSKTFRVILSALFSVCNVNVVDVH